MADNDVATKQPAVAPPVHEPAGKTSSGGGGSSLADQLLALQSSVGNATTLSVVQAKLVVGPANDPAETEADDIAAAVLDDLRRGGAPPDDGDGANGDANDGDGSGRSDARRAAMRRRIRRAAASSVDPLGGLEVDHGTTQAIDRARGQGQQLPSKLRTELEPRFGADFSNVRVHTDANADQLSRSLQARAFTTGSDLFFSKGEYAPNTDSGREVLAHELAHVVQQSGVPTTRRRVRRLKSLKEFKKETNEGTFVKRGQALQAIDTWLKEWEELTKTPGTKGSARKKEQLLLQMKYGVDEWIKDHTIAETGEKDPSRQKRMVGMVSFGQSVDAELITLRNILKNSYALDAVSDIQEDQAGDKFKKLKAKYEGNATSTLNKLAWMIDMAVPNKGDESELEIEFRWPVDPSGIAFVGGRLKANAQRDSAVGAAAGGQAGVTVRVELVVTVGAQWMDLAELKVELGGYFEASAKNSQDVTTLISYAIYRRWRESYVLPDGAANVIWGGRKGSYGKAKAEQWSNKVEKTVFGDALNQDAYVESGGLVSVGGKVGVKKGNLGGAQLEGKLTYTNGTRYDDESIKNAKGALGAKNTKSKNANLSNAQTKLGRTVQTLQFSFEAAAGPITGGAEAKAKWIADQSQDKDATVQELDSVELMFSGKAAVPTVGHGDTVSKVIRYLGPGLMTLVKIIRRGVEANKQKSQQEGQKAKNAGAVFGSLEDGVPAISEILKLGKPDEVDFSETKDAVSELGKSDASSKIKEGAQWGNAVQNMKVESTAGIKLSIGVNCLDPEVQLILSYEKAFEFKVPAFLGIKAKKTERIVAVSMKKSAGWKPELS